MRIDGYSVPTIRLYPRLMEALRIIYTKFGLEKIPSLEALAEALRHKTANSGTFLLKVSCLRAYGLLKKRELRLSDLGKRLVTSTSREERSEALKEAILNIPLWKEFYDRWGLEIPEESFLEEFRKITGISGEEAEHIAEKVKQAYLEDVRRLQSSETATVKYNKVEEQTIRKVSEENVEETTPSLLPKKALARVTVKGVGFVDIFDLDTYKIAMSLMKLIEKQIVQRHRE